MHKKIKIPKGLGLAVMNDRHARKLLDTWLRLKVVFDNGYFNYNTSSLKDLEEVCGVSYKTILKRLRAAEELKLVKLDSGKAYLAPYKALSSAFGEVFTGSYFVKWELLEVLSIENFLEAKAIEEKQTECKKAYYYKLAKSQAKEKIKGVMPEGSGRSFTAGATMAHLIDYLQGSKSENSWLFSVGRSDVQLSYRRLSELFNYNSKGGLAYKKRKLQALGLINIVKRSVTFNREAHSTQKQRKTELGSVHYRRSDGKLRLVMPDEITFLSQAQILAK